MKHFNQLHSLPYVVHHVIPLKNFLFLIFVLIISLNTIAQTGWYASFAGDTIVLNVSGQNGTIQWQQSSDSINWINIESATSTPYEFLTTLSPTGKWFYRAEISNATICENAYWYSSLIKVKIITTTANLIIGDLFQGGIVYFIDSVGNGLISPLASQSTGIQWGCNGINISGTDDFYDGEENTGLIIANCADRPIAASICDELSLNDYNDWFLPAMYQMTYVCSLNSILNIGAGYYWTSSSSGSELSAICCLHSSAEANMCLISGEQKNTNRCVHCIRSFTSDELSMKIYLYSSVLQNPLAVSITTPPDAQNTCLNSNVTFSVTAEGTSPIIYQLQKNGIDIPGATDSIYAINNLNLTDQGNFTCEVTNLCRSVTSDTAKLKVIQLDADAGTADNLCPGESAKLMADCTSNYPVESGAFGYLWSPSSGLSDTNISTTTATPSITTNYSVTVTDQLGCTASDQINIFVQQPYQNEQVCLVTVDTSIMKNKIYWQKTNDAGTMLYIIYKETVPDDYEQVGNVSFYSLGEFIDIFSHPDQQSSKYKITVIDTCGNESETSYYHKTIHLSLDAFNSIMGLAWDEYVDESDTFSPQQYYIYRGTSPSNMILHDSVWGFINTYNDFNVDSVYYYMIGVYTNNPENFNGNMSFSNIIDNCAFFNNSSVVINSDTDNELTIYPNPFSESATIQFYNPDNSQFTFILADLKGSVVRKIDKINNNEILLLKKNLNSGIYFIELKSKDKTYRSKIMIE